jgi:hypothetical protein
MDDGNAGFLIINRENRDYYVSLTNSTPGRPDAVRTVNILRSQDGEFKVEGTYPLEPPIGFVDSHATFDPKIPDQIDS